jgi:hypothetical protein
MNTITSNEPFRSVTEKEQPADQLTVNNTTLTWCDLIRRIDDIRFRALGRHEIRRAAYRRHIRCNFRFHRAKMSSRPTLGVASVSLGAVVRYHLLIELLANRGSLGFGRLGHATITSIGHGARTPL